MAQEEIIKAKEQIKEALQKDFTVKVDFGGNILRVQKATKTDGFFILQKRRRYYGWYFDNYIERSNPEYIKVIANKVNKEDRWLKQMKRIEKMLEESGLWKDVLQDIKLAISVGLDNIVLADEIYWKDYKDLSYEEGNERKAKLIEAVDKRLVEHKDGKVIAKTEIIWNYDKIPKIKKMRIYRNIERNNDELKLIAEKMKRKEKYTVCNRVDYDVSFEYHPEKEKAFYSEEYRGCGNGHYYIALNATHALYREKD